MAARNKPNEIYITRIYDASVKTVWDAWTDPKKVAQCAPDDLMFEMWTNPKHFSQWLPPTGFTMKYLRADIKVGGSSFYCLSGEGDTKMYGKAWYKEINKLDRIVYTQVFCDENEKITRHPMAPTWPETMLTTVTLAEEAPEKTRVTITWEIDGDATTIEREAFNKAKDGMTQGWSGSFAKLEDYLKNQEALF